MAASNDTRDNTRERIMEAAEQLLLEGGQAAVTTRGVAARAGVQAPTIYRLFGDKGGLLDAVAEHVMTGFVEVKTAAVATGTSADPVDDLRQSWEMTIDFGLANPALFVLLADPARGQRSPAAKAGIHLLAERVQRVALAGRLRVGEDEAVELIHAAGTGAILAILARPEGQRDRRLAETLLEATLGQILAPPQSTRESAAEDEVSRSIAHAVALRVRAAKFQALTASEQALLAEWLERIINSYSPPDIPQV